jgi:hypothetical protein
MMVYHITRKSASLLYCQSYAECAPALPFLPIGGNPQTRVSNRKMELILIVVDSFA